MRPRQCTGCQYYLRYEDMDYRQRKTAMDTGYPVSSKNFCTKTEYIPIRHILCCEHANHERGGASVRA